MPAAVSHTPDARFRQPRKSFRFFYNSVLLPEYYSATILSILCTLPSLWVPLAEVCLKARPAAWQLWPGIALYLTLAVWLVTTTIDFRRRYSRIEVSRDELGQEWLVFPAGRLAARDLRHGLESITRFFGRRARQLELVDTLGKVWTVNDGLFGYDHFRWLVAEGLGVPVACTEPAEVVDKIGERWRKRQEHFTEDPIRGRFHPRTSRWVLLFPVLFVDLAFTGIAHVLLDRAGLADWAPLSASAGLLLSAAAARHIYYRLLTTEFLN